MPHPKASRRDGGMRSPGASSFQKQGQPSCSKQSEELEAPAEEKHISSQQGAVDILPWEARPESVERTEMRPSRSRTTPAPPALSFQMPQHPRISSEEGGSAAQDEPPSGSGDSSDSDTTSEGPPRPCSSRFGVDEVRGPTQASGLSFEMGFAEIVVAP